MFFGKVSFESLLCVDFHSHLIPNIDDGAVDMHNSIELIRGLSDLGFKKFITTPHIKKNKYDNDAHTIRQGLNELREIIIEEGMDVHIEAAAEYYCDEAFLKSIKNEDILHINRYVLIEFSYLISPVNIEEIIYELKAKDYIPVLAHPERYPYYHNKLDRYDHLKNLGVHFQINLNSLVGYYSKEVKKAATYLSQKGYVDFVGSDTHHQKHISSLRKVAKSSEFKMLLKNNNILNNTLFDGLA